MRRALKAAFLVAALAMGSSWAAAQEKPPTEDATMKAHPLDPTPLRVAVTFTEFEGDKKVKSLPYTTIVIADGKNSKSVLKMGNRVPVYTGKEYGMQYLDVGSNIDCTASRTKDNKFDLLLSLERSWVEGNVSAFVDPGASAQTSGQFPEPIVRQFRSELSVTLHDGQTVESSFATDPLSGKVFKVEVSLNIVK